MRNFIFLTTLLLTTFAHAGRIDEVRALLDRTVYACPDRIWKGLDWKTARITLISPSANEAIALQSGQVEILDPSKNQLNAQYDFDKNNLSINVDHHQNAEDAFALLVHEGFHAFGQSDFKHSADKRDDIYPESYEPRLEREELTRALIAHFRGEEGALEKAAAWHLRHASHKEELGTDVFEGSAEYVEKIASAIAKHGCEASDKVITNSAVESIAEQGGAFDKSYEHYRIGALGFLLARPQMEEVLSKIGNTKIPLDIIFESVKADMSVSPDMLMEHAAEMTVNLANRRSEEIMNPIKEHIKEGQALVFVAYEDLRGSFEHNGSFSSEGTTYYHNLILQTDSTKIEGNGFAAKSCGGKSGFLVVTNTPITSSEKPVKFKGSDVTCL